MTTTMRSVVNDHGDGGLSPGFDIGDEEQVVMAVPQKYVNGEIFLAERLWPLAPVHDEPGLAWKVIEKRQLHGVSVVRQDGGLVVLHKGQRVIDGP